MVFYKLSAPSLFVYRIGTRHTPSAEKIQVILMVLNVEIVIVDVVIVEEVIVDVAVVADVVEVAKVLVVEAVEMDEMKMSVVSDAG